MLSKRIIRPTDSPKSQRTDKSSDKPANKPTDKHTNKRADKPTQVPTDKHTNKRADKPTQVPTDKLTDKQADRVPNKTRSKQPVRGTVVKSTINEKSNSKRVNSRPTDGIKSAEYSSRERASRPVRKTERPKKKTVQ